MRYRDCRDFGSDLGHGVDLGRDLGSDLGHGSDPGLDLGSDPWWRFSKGYDGCGQGCDCRIGSAMVVLFGDLHLRLRM